MPVFMPPPEKIRLKGHSILELQLSTRHATLAGTVATIATNPKPFADTGQPNRIFCPDMKSCPADEFKRA
jgi:hypothetical protein